MCRVSFHIYHIKGFIVTGKEHKITKYADKIILTLDESPESLFNYLITLKKILKTNALLIKNK